MDSKETEAKNLAAIQRIDPLATAIIDKAAQTALYSFKKETMGWEKTQVDGPFFLYRRADHPLYSVMIANRQSPNDFIEPLVTGVRLKLEAPYVYLFKPDGRVWGFWFYQKEDCERAYRLLDHIATSVARGEQPSLDVVKGALPVPPPSSNASNSVLELIQAMSNSGNNSAPKAVSPARAAPPPAAATSSNSPASLAPAHVIRKLIASETRTFQQQPKNGAAAAALSATDLERSLLAGNLSSSTGPPSTTNATLNSSAGKTPATPTSAAVPPVVRAAGIAATFAPLHSSSAASLAAYSTRSQRGSDVDLLDPDMQIGPLPTEADAINEVVGLSADQLVVAFRHLLNSDPSFVGRLHDAYAEALNRRLRL